MKHLIKRKNLGYKMSDGWLCEVKIGGLPSGSKVTKEDLIYIAQNGYAIFGSGIVKEVKILKKRGLNEFIKYALITSNVKDDGFWLSKIREYCKMEGSESIEFNILEYYLENVSQFDISYPLEDRFLNQSSWYYLEDDFELRAIERTTELTSHIPTKFREEIYHQFKIQRKEHLIDIDHLVPASLGGPGNIIENLVPLSASINRRKSNRVPSKIFDIGRKYNISIPSGVKISHDIFYADKKLKILARQIIEKINANTLEEIREDYSEIRRFHFPSS